MGRTRRRKTCGCGANSGKGVYSLEGVPVDLICCAIGLIVGARTGADVPYELPGVVGPKLWRKLDGPGPRRAGVDAELVVVRPYTAFPVEFGVYGA